MALISNPPKPTALAVEPLLGADEFVNAIRMAVRAACSRIGLPLPNGIYVVLDAAHAPEYAANDTIIRSVHKADIESLDRVSGLIGSVIVSYDEAGCPAVSVVATLRREFAKATDAGLEVFWRVHAVRNEAPSDPDQLSLF